METIMKKILLTLALLIPNTVIHANKYPLCPESKQFIMNSAIAGGLLAGGIGLLAAFDKQSKEYHNKNKTTWEKIKTFPWHYVILPALAGAAGAGFIASFFTTEEYLKSAEKELATLESNLLLDTAMTTDDAAQLKRLAFQSHYPTLKTYEKLESLLAQINRAKEYLFTVIKSGSSTLASIAQAGLERLKEMEQKIIEWMSKLKDAQYFKELNAWADAQFKQKMLEAAQRTARAAESHARASQSAAHAAWHNVYHHVQPVYVAPPVNVFLKK